LIYQIKTKRAERIMEAPSEEGGDIIEMTPPTEEPISESKAPAENVCGSGQASAEYPDIIEFTLP
jgi:hypothetical protein